MKYELQGPYTPKTAAAIVIGELERIMERDGGLRPDAIVRDSEPEHAPLHAEFEWDDPAAAHEYRIEQARRIVRAVHIVPDPAQRESFAPLRAFVSMSRPSAGGGSGRAYESTLDVLRNSNARANLMRQMRNEVIGMRQRYMNIAEFAELLEPTLSALTDALSTDRE